MPSRSPFFIFGAPRSGTSLLSRILNHHPRVAVPPESYIYDTFTSLQRLYSDLEQTANLDRLVRDILATPKIRDWSPAPTPQEVVAAVETPTLGGVFGAVLSIWAAATGKARWGEKTPSHAYFWDTIAEAYPDAPIIHLVRDGRDVALSQISARFGPKTTYRAARRWARYMDTMERLTVSLPASQIHVVRYEHLMEEPEIVIRSLCVFLDEPFEASMLDFYENVSPYSRYSREHGNLERPLQRGNTERWRTLMSQRDVATFEGAAGNQLTQWGYNLATAASGISAGRRFIENWVLHPPRKGLGLLRNRTGQRVELALLVLRIRIAGRYLQQRLVGQA